tara:strand:- start:1139 stop:1858 length:720 start_codon:yes stop_codon:yes gene_type:complete
MKTKQKQARGIVIFLLALLITAPAYATQEKTGEQNRNTAPFHGISVSSGIDLYLTQGSSEKVVVEADPDVIDAILTEVNDGVLHIYMKKTFGFQWNRSSRVHVTFDDLTSLSVSAGADVEAQNPFKLNELRISVSAGADIQIEELLAESVWLDTSSGSDASLSGRVVNFEASSSSGADISCSGLVAEHCVVSVSSGSDAEVHATKSLKASASSGGDIRYKGNPTQKNINESSGGDVYSD